jgi:hypothetical protein
LPGDHRKVYSNRSEADFVMPSGIITTYLSLRLLVISGFPNTYPFSVRKSTEDENQATPSPGAP